MRLKELDVAKKAALEGGKILMEDYGKVSIRYKEDRSIATEADVASEKKIKSILKGEFPSYSLLGEEFGLEKGISDYMWVIDPLDGTTNYCMRNPFFGVSIALVYKNEPLIGVVYYPAMDETFYAEKGEGAYLNNERIFVSSVTEIRDSMITFCHGRDQNSLKEMINIFGKLKLINNKVRQIGAAALELCYVACGRVDSFFMVGVNPWDIAAGVVIVKEAKGKVSDFEAKPFNMGSKDILASNGKIHERLLKLIIERIK